MKLHLGCGKRFIPGYTHVDVVDYPHVELRCAVDRMPMIRDAAATLVYSAHVLEHFHRRDTQRVLAEWKRVLQPWGILRIAVPDLEALCQLYQLTEDASLILGPLFGRGDYLYNVHYTAFDFTTLKKELEDAGFSNVKRYDWRATEHAEVDDYSQSYYPHMNKTTGRLLSLNVEATR